MQYYIIENVHFLFVSEDYPLATKMPPSSQPHVVSNSPEAFQDVQGHASERYPLSFSYIATIIFVIICILVIRFVRQRRPRQIPPKPSVPNTDKPMTGNQKGNYFVDNGSPPGGSISSKFHHCCSSIWNPYDFGPTCYKHKPSFASSRTPQPPGPTIRRHSEQPELCGRVPSCLQVTHSTFTRRESAPAAGRTVITEGEIWHAKDSMTGNGWRRKQWSVMG